MQRRRRMTRKITSNRDEFPSKDLLLMINDNAYDPTEKLGNNLGATLDLDSDEEETVVARPVGKSFVRKKSQAAFFRQIMRLNQQIQQETWISKLKHKFFKSRFYKRFQLLKLK